MILVGCIIGGPISFTILFCVITALSINEFATIIGQNNEIQINRRICILAGIFMFLAFGYIGLVPRRNEVFIPYLLLLLYIFISELYMKKKNPVHNWAYSMMSQIYIALPFSLLNILAYYSLDGQTLFQDTLLSFHSLFSFSTGLMIQELTARGCFSESTVCLSASHLKNHGKVQSVEAFSASWQHGE